MHCMAELFPLKFHVQINYVMLNINFSPKYSSHPNLCQAWIPWIRLPCPKFWVLLKIQMIPRLGWEHSSLLDTDYSHADARSIQGYWIRLLLKGNALAPFLQCLCQLTVGTPYLSSQCKQCHPEDLLTLGLFPFVGEALESYCSSAVRTQESAADIKEKTNIKIYRLFDFLDYELSKIGEYFIST